MTNISKYHSVKVISAVMGLVVLSELAVAQDLGKNDSVSVRTEKTDMPYKVKGRIIDAVTKKGFAGARVTTPNLNVSAMTDENGNYEIGVPDLSVALYVEAPGYSRQVVPVKGRNEVDVSLFTVSGHAYYDDGMSVSDGEAVVDGFTSGTLSMTDDMTSLLNGQLRAISHSGDPGSSSSFFIRGYNSVNLSAQPLFVVDGVIWQMQDQVASAVDNYYNNPLTLLDPSDIEKVTILKNGSAVWGAKGANGVVLIDTKRAREMATQIEANISMGFQTPFESLPLMGAAAYRRYATDIMSGMKRDEVEGFQFTNDDPTRSFYRAVHNDTKWTNEINKTSFIQNYGVSVAGGDDIALYRFSLGYAKNDGNIDGTSFNRLNVRFNSDIKLTEDFKIQTDISYAQTGHKVVFEGLDGMRSPYFLSLVKSPLYAPWQYNDNGTFSGRLTDVDELNVGNPLALTGEDVPELDKYRFNLNLRPSYQITDRLEVAALFGISYDKENENLFIPDAGVSNEPLYNDRGEIYATALNEVRNLMARQTSMSVDGYLAWQILKDWRHDLNARIGGRFYNTYYRYTMGQGYNTGNDYMIALSNTNSDLRTLTGHEYTDRNTAWYFNADYAYRHRYFFNVGMSLETSSRFGREAGGLDLFGVSWGYFPSVSGAWLVSSEKFMRNVDFVNNLKVRVAYTMSGNDNLPLFANRSYFTSTSFVKDATGLVLANIGNEKLKWETTARTNIGLDFSMFSNRLAVNADVFFSRTKDLVTRRPLNDEAGLEYFWDNNGELKNNGLEVAVKVRALDMRDFKLNIGATVGHYKNEVTSLENGSFITEVCDGQVLTEVGRPVGVFYGYLTDGVYSTSQEAAEAGLAILSSSGQRVPFQAGDIRFIDVKKDGIINEEDRVVIGDPNPDIYGNFDLNFQWKNLELGALFTYSLGNDAYNALRASLESGKSLYNQSVSMENRWMANGQQTDIPRATYDDPMGNSRFSDRWIEDASYLKFKRLMLTYHVPMRQNFIQSLSVWAAVNNVCTLTKYLGVDPEFSYSTSVLGQGIDGGLTPQSRSFQLGVNINL